MSLYSIQDSNDVSGGLKENVSSDFKVSGSKDYEHATASSLHCRTTNRSREHQLLQYHLSSQKKLHKLSNLVIKRLNIEDLLEPVKSVQDDEDRQLYLAKLEEFRYHELKSSAVYWVLRSSIESQKRNNLEAVKMFENALSCVHLEHDLNALLEKRKQFAQVLQRRKEDQLARRLMNFSPSEVNKENLVDIHTCNGEIVSHGKENAVANYLVKHSNEAPQNTKKRWVGDITTTKHNLESRKPLHQFNPLHKHKEKWNVESKVKAQMMTPIAVSKHRENRKKRRMAAMPPLFHSPQNSIVILEKKFEDSPMKLLEADIRRHSLSIRRFTNDPNRSLERIHSARRESIFFGIAAPPRNLVQNTKVKKIVPNIVSNSTIPNIGSNTPMMNQNMDCDDEESSLSSELVSQNTIVVQPTQWTIRDIPNTSEIHFSSAVMNFAPSKDNQHMEKIFIWNYEAGLHSPTGKDSPIKFDQITPTKNNVQSPLSDMEDDSDSEETSSSIADSLWMTPQFTPLTITPHQQVERQSPLKGVAICFDEESLGLVNAQPKSNTNVTPLPPSECSGSYINNSSTLKNSPPSTGIRPSNAEHAIELIGLDRQESQGQAPQRTLNDNPQQTAIEQISIQQTLSTEIDQMEIESMNDEINSTHQSTVNSDTKIFAHPVLPLKRSRQLDFKRSHNSKFAAQDSDDDDEAIPSQIIAHVTPSKSRVRTPTCNSLRQESPLTSPFDFSKLTQNTGWTPTVTNKRTPRISLGSASKVKRSLTPYEFSRPQTISPNSKSRRNLFSNFQSEAEENNLNECSNDAIETPQDAYWGAKMSFQSPCRTAIALKSQGKVQGSVAGNLVSNVEINDNSDQDQSPLSMNLDETREMSQDCDEGYLQNIETDEIDMDTEEVQLAEIQSESTSSSLSAASNFDPFTSTKETIPSQQSSTFNQASESFVVIDDSFLQKEQNPQQHELKAEHSMVTKTEVDISAELNPKVALVESLSISQQHFQFSSGTTSNDHHTNSTSEQIDDPLNQSNCSISTTQGTKSSLLTYETPMPLKVLSGDGVSNLTPMNPCRDGFLHSYGSPNDSEICVIIYQPPVNPLTRLQIRQRAREFVYLRQVKQLPNGQMIELPPYIRAGPAKSGNTRRGAKSMKFY